MKILFVTTISNTVNAFLIPHIKMLVEEGHQVDLAFRIEQELKSEIFEMGCTIYDIPFQRSPLSKSNYLSYQKIKKIMEDNGYDLIHTHTPVASAITRLAAKKFRMNGLKVFYTAHGFHFFKGAPFFNWVVYYPIEKYLSKYTDCIITINQEDYKRACKKFRHSIIKYVPGIGLDISRFNSIKMNNDTKKKELGLTENSFVLLSVGELNKNKNHEVVIKAIFELNCLDIEYVICGTGPLEAYLKEKSKEMNLEKRVHFLGFRNDIPEICNICDTFVFPSLREGLGMAALEAMACGLPIITSNIHGIVDYSVDGKTGFMCNARSSTEFVKAIKRIKNDKDLRERISKANVSFAQKYSLENILKEMKLIYKL